MLIGRMVLVVTTTLVHLAVLGSGALFGSWRVEDQVRQAHGLGRGRQAACSCGPQPCAVPNTVVFQFSVRRHSGTRVRPNPEENRIAPSIRGHGGVLSLL